MTESVHPEPEDEFAEEEEVDPSEIPLDDAEPVGEEGLDETPADAVP